MGSHRHQGGHHEHHHHSDGDHNSMRPHTHIAYHHVEMACAADVERLCPVEQPSLLFFDDPILNWLLMPTGPSPPIPELDNIGPLIDQMMESALAMPITFSVVVIEDSQEESQMMAPPAEQVVETFVSKMAQEQPEEIPLLAQQLVQHGHQVLEQDDATEELRHLARRLTEVKPDQMYHGVHLPFGCSRNRCLMAASQEGMVSGPCLATMTQLQQVNEMEIILEEQQGDFLTMMWVYCLLLIMALVLMGRRYAQNKANRQLKLRILKAVYANPSIKAQLEQDLGESVGNVPPVSYHALRMMGAGGMALRRKIQCFRRVRIVFFLVLSSMVIFAPFWVLPICIVVSAIRVAVLCCAPAPVRECTCCCCGVSTEDVTNGLVTDAQACCNCCVGTGVCSPACASCCGNDGCSCGDEDCCCCNADSNSKIVKGCGSGGCCCCCGASPEQVATGTLTDAQACYCCCSGTGCCSGDSSCCCCSGDDTVAPKGRGQKHVFQAKEGIYEGVPIQVV